MGDPIGRVNASEPLSFGSLLRELRLAAGLTQEALAELAHMSAGGIGVLERGARRAPQRDTMDLLAAALELSDSERDRFDNAARRAGSSRRRRARSGNVSERKGHNLPFPLTSFVGRDRESASLRDHVATHRLVMLAGLGGVGKTRLALETAHSMLDAFRDGIWYVELAPIGNADRVLPSIAAALGVRGNVDVSSDQWMSELADKQQLLILDNCEHVLTATTAVSQQLLERCPSLHILATSREPLKLTGERVIRLRPLGEPAAIELFIDRARNALPEFAISEDAHETRRYVRTICEQLDGIPFAIELAAARVSTLPVKILADNIDQRLKLLRHGTRASVPRHKTMRALIDWSYDLLSEFERRVFENLSIFRGGCEFETAVRIFGCGDIDRFEVLEILTSLVDKSLVIVDFDADAPRYGLLESVREYAHEKLTARTDLEQLLRRHAEAYLELALDFDQKWNAGPDHNWYAQARSERENLRAAIDWSLDKRHDVALGQRITGALVGVWMTFALIEGRQRCRSALELIDDTTPLEIVAKLEYVKALLAFLSGEFVVALGASEQALTKYRALSDSFGVARAKVILGSSLVFCQRAADGEQVLSEALELANHIENPLLVVYVHQALGSSRGMAGDHEAAREHFAKGLAIAEEASAQRPGVIASINLAEAYFHLGDANKAIALARKALDVSRTLGDEHSIVALLKNLAKYLPTSNRYDEAKTAARESLERSSHARGTARTAWTLQHLAMLAALNPHDGDSQAMDDRARSARILGYTEARLAAIGDGGDFAEQAERERLKRILTDALGAQRLAQLTSSGAAMTESEVIEEAMAI